MNADYCQLIEQSCLIADVVDNLFPLFTRLQPYEIAPLSGERFPIVTNHTNQVNTPASTCKANDNSHPGFLGGKSLYVILCII